MLLILLAQKIPPALNKTKDLFRKLNKRRNKGIFDKKLSVKMYTNNCTCNGTKNMILDLIKC